jgi:hypothetical protein
MDRELSKGDSMAGAVQGDMIRCVAHSANRFTIEIATTPQEF